MLSGKKIKKCNDELLLDTWVRGPRGRALKVRKGGLALVM